jgi:hypothetical protein
LPIKRVKVLTRRTHFHELVSRQHTISAGRRTKQRMSSHRRRADHLTG